MDHKASSNWLWVVCIQKSSIHHVNELIVLYHKYKVDQIQRKKQLNTSRKAFFLARVTWESLEHDEKYDGKRKKSPLSNSNK